MIHKWFVMLTIVLTIKDHVDIHFYPNEVNEAMLRRRPQKMC